MMTTYEITYRTESGEDGRALIYTWSTMVNSGAGASFSDPAMAPLTFLAIDAADAADIAGNLIRLFTYAASTHEAITTGKAIQL